MPDLKKQLLFNAGKLKVYLVDGSAVRRDIDIEYVAGGHDLRYEYIPEGEVWLDDEQHEDELYPVLLHELYERQRMASGVTYEDAHNESSEVEQHYRKNREGIEDKIMQEVENNLNIGMNKLSNALKILEQ